MATYSYSIDDKEYSSDTPLTEADLLELSGSAKEEPSRVAEAMRTGLAGGTGVLAGLAGAANSMLQGNVIPFVNAQKTIDAFTQNYQNVREPTMGMLGSTGAKPRSQSEQIMMGGISAATDPSTYLLPSTAGVKLAKGVGVPLYKAAEGFLTGSGSEAGGIAGETIGRDIGGESGAQIGRVAGALTGGVGTGVVAGGAPRVASMAMPAIGKVKNLISKARGLEPIEQAEQAAQKHINNIFVAAATADPNFADVFEQAILAQEKTGVKLPLSAMMKDNPVINSYIGHLANKDPAFRKAYFEQFEEAKNALGKKATLLFGDVAEADKTILKSVTKKGEDFTTIGNSVNRKLNSISEDVRKTSSNLEEINPAEFGSRIVKVTEDAEAAARAATAPKYKAAFDIAKLKGLDLPKESVEDIYNTVVDGKNSDIFATFPSIYGKVKNTFKPKEKPEFAVTEYGLIPIGYKSEFSKASIEDLNSLKLEINLQLRKARTDSHIRVLQDLKTKLDENINKLDGEFVDAYRAADKTYLTKVGLPFNTETIKAIERAKFDENIVPLLTRNKSTTSQFLSVTGEDGKRLVEDAFISDLTKNAVRDGVVDPNRAKAWMASRREQLALLPETKTRIESLTKDVDALLGRKKLIEQSFDDATKARILKSEGVGAQELVTKMYGNSAFTDRFIKQYGNDKDAMKAVRSFMLDDIIKAGKPLEVLNDRTRKNVYDNVFGKSYTGMVNDLALISDRITKDPSNVATNIKNIDADILTKMIGMPPERLTSLFFTNPVVSKPVAIMTVVNRFFNKKAGEIVERDMKNILLDREAGTRILHAMKPTADGKLNLERLNEFSSWAKKRGYDFGQMLKNDAMAGAVRSYRGMNQEEIQQEEE